MTTTTTAAAAVGVGDPVSSSSAIGHPFNAIPTNLHNRVQDNPSQTSFNGSSAMPAAPQNQSLDPLSQSQPSTHSQSSSNTAHLHHQTTHPFDPTSIFPQHLMQEFIRLSTPVGQNPDDDTILARALCDSKQNGKTYRQALEGLHGVNNHAANLWKDYYLDHHDRIEILVSRLTQQPKTIKKPFTGSISPPRVPPKTSSSQLMQKRKRSTASALPLPKRTALASSQSQHKRFSHTPPANGRPPNRPRETFNSLSAPVVTANIRGLTPPQADISVPDPPSRSPSPPTKLQLGTHGNRYTAEDREYFIKFITWRLNQSPSLTKRQLCDQLAEKVPHHSANSWASHWHSRHDLADKILATYRDLAYAESDHRVSGADSATRSKKHHPQNDTSDSSGSETWSDFGDSDADTEDDEADMGEPGTGFTRGDWCVLARFIARTDWHELTPKERFDMFVETYVTKRSAKAWGEFYRKHEDVLLKMAKRYSKRKRGSEDIRSRRARPSWAQPATRGLQCIDSNEAENEGADDSDNNL